MTADTTDRKTGTLRDRVLAQLAVAQAQPKRSLGQNFLVSETAIARILQAARGVGEVPRAVVEVGPGLGSLTEELLQLPSKICLIELDRDFAALWRTRLEGRAGASVIEADALKLDWSTLGLDEGALLVSNLPYQISSSLVIERSIAPCGIARMILMFQKEVAQRLMARPKTPEYGLLTAVAQAFWDIRMVLEAGPRDFYPPPKVASRVLEFRAKPPAAVTDRALFLRFVKAAFAHRRKLMSRNLSQGYFGGRAESPAAIAAAMADLGFNATQTRAEELSAEQFQLLHQALLGVS